MTIKELCKNFPGRFIIRAKIWTDQRNTIESQGQHDPLNGRLISLLLCRDLQGEERDLAEQLIKKIKGEDQ